MSFEARRTMLRMLISIEIRVIESLSQGKSKQK